MFYAQESSTVTLKKKTSGKEPRYTFSLCKQSLFRAISPKVTITLPKGLWSTRVFWEQSGATFMGKGNACSAM